jgi:NCS1 family nucleobase:cation symporter-1
MTNNTSGSAKATSIETNDVSPISAGERHGKPWHLFTVWSSPNLEFATVFIGFLAVIAFGLNVWQAIAAVVVGNTLAAITHGILSTWGPKKGLPQMVLGRSAFGFLGNLIPAGLSTLVAGIGWFAVNSTSGAFALQALTGLPIELSLAIIVLAQIGVAFVGHNLIQKFERYAFFYLVVVFGIGAIIVLSKGNYAVPADKSAFNLIGFTLTAAAAYGYTAGWTAFASDYTRYLPENTNSRQLGWAAGLGNWFATTLLMIVGAVAWTIASPDGNPTGNFTALLGSDVLAKLTLLGIAVGSVGANVLNVYSGAMSFLAMGFKLGFKTRRALMVALAGIIGSITAYAAIKGDFVGNFEGFLLVVSYWVAPWIAVVLTDWLLRGRSLSDNVLDTKRENYAGPIAFVIATAGSIALFCNQIAYTGPLAKAWAIGDITPLVGFAVAAALYAALFKSLGKN